MTQSSDSRGNLEEEFLFYSNELKEKNGKLSGSKQSKPQTS